MKKFVRSGNLKRVKRYKRPLKWNEGVEISELVWVKLVEDTERMGYGLRFSVRGHLLNFYIRNRQRIDLSARRNTCVDHSRDLAFEMFNRGDYTEIK